MTLWDELLISSGATSFALSFHYSTLGCKAEDALIQTSVHLFVYLARGIFAQAVAYFEISPYYPLPKRNLLACNHQNSFYTCTRPSSVPNGLLWMLHPTAKTRSGLPTVSIAFLNEQHRDGYACAASDCPRDRMDSLDDNTSRYVPTKANI